MLYFIQGKIFLKTPTYIVLESNGIGYFIEVSLQTSEKIQEGDEVLLYVYQQLSEDKINLYGFKEKEERELFLLLITVPGIGPKVALRILSGLTIEEIYQGIVTENLSFFKNVPGIGRKTAERIIVELKQKIEKIPVLVDNNKERELLNNSVEALVVLGYKRKDAIGIVSQILKEKNREISLEDLIKEALRRLK
ncbi:MAG: Holliday junction branch migration protein RuvA [Candidatus Omnitrophica bacterium]|nr:Holliday junction branch migration protein RuvA [Candidatus Omnitrophota bacterium]MCM8809544.1 Holliday junction branch migration protein RuvA [Candidatus Omnitrophota bacterium]MCM8811066.1 Holliday junction branch migration protein RuvA [Candidatus Omnitrophota bacterium]MCM8833290.1 Holliday junction branch migration protein RuvA [Candidatus Omnitrophota bacterium]